MEDLATVYAPLSFRLRHARKGERVLMGAKKVEVSNTDCSSSGPGPWICHGLRNVCFHRTLEFVTREVEKTLRIISSSEYAEPKEIGIYLCTFVKQMLIALE